MKEGDIFKIIIPLQTNATQKVGGQKEFSVTNNNDLDTADKENKVNSKINNKDEFIKQIKNLIQTNNKITRKEIAIHFNVSVSTIRNYLRYIKNLRYAGTGKNGHWEFFNTLEKFE